MQKLDINTKIGHCCNIIVVLGPDQYDAACRENGVNRLLDAPDEYVLKLWTDKCALTQHRAMRIINTVGAFNRKNLARQINAEYSVYDGRVLLTINGAEYKHADYVAAVTALRYAGLKFDFK